MDPQSNLTSGLGFNPYSLTHTVADAILEPDQSVDELIVRTKWPGLHLLPANPDLSAVEAGLPTTLDAETRLRRALDRDCRDYDFILFDTPPSFAFHTISVLAATDYVVIPMQMSGYAVKGLKETLRSVHHVRQELNPDLRVLGLLPTFVVMRTRFSRDLLDGLARDSEPSRLQHGHQGDRAPAGVGARGRTGDRDGAVVGGGRGVSLVRRRGAGRAHRRGRARCLRSAQRAAGGASRSLQRCSTPPSCRRMRPGA